MRILAFLAVCLALSACATADKDELASVAYRSDAPASATLVTVTAGEGGSGVHSALVINASERVIYDPAGTFSHPDTRRVGDVIYGVTDEVLDLFALHNADVWHVATLQTAPLPPRAAETLLERARDNGGALPGFCAISVSEVIDGVPPLAAVEGSMWPGDLREDFAKLPGVRTVEVRDDDEFTPLKGQ